MKQRMTKEAFERRIANRAQEIATIHGPEGMELRIADFDDDERTYGVAARFPGNMRHGIKVWPFHEHKPKPELYAEAAVRALIAWHRRKSAELEIERLCDIDARSQERLTLQEAANG